MLYSLYERCLQGIMVVVFIETNINKTWLIIEWMAIKAYHAMQYSTYILTDVLMYKVLLYIVMSQCAVFWWAG